MLENCRLGSVCFWPEVPRTAVFLACKPSWLPVAMRVESRVTETAVGVT